MELYYKEWDKEEVQIPKDAIIMDKGFAMSLKTIVDYPMLYCWEVWSINRIKENKDGYFDFSKNMIDIGAGLAEYCWCLPFNHAYAFEPNKKTEYLIHANLVMQDKVDKVDTINCLLSDKHETIYFNGFTCFEDNASDKPGLIQQETKTLDDFEFQNVGFIKIDVEGMEEKVLRGGLRTIILNNYPPILFECWDTTPEFPKEKRDSLFNLLKMLGYEILEYWGDWETHLAVHKNQLNK